MSVKQYIKRGLNYILTGIPIKDIRAQVVYLSPNRRLAGKKIILTGGGRGLGAAMCDKFIAEGAEVLIVGRNEVTLKEQSLKSGCKFMVLDVDEVDKFPDFINKANELLGGVNCLVNNAGISLHEGGIHQVSLESYEQQFSTNLRAAYFLSQQFIEHCIKEKIGCADLLFVSSERGDFVDVLPYGLTKAALNSLVQGLAHCYIRQGIRCNAIAPGVTASDLTGYKSSGNLYCKYNINERVYFPEEMAEIACFLLSDASRCINGQIITCNEGKSINNVR